MDPDMELGGFDGVSRLFPLPDVVLFPHCVLPLHIFEPRYKQMAQDALRGDRLITMVKLQDGVDWHSEVDPPIETVACLGKIFDHQRLADGRYNILLIGLKRVRLVAELEKDRLYRKARVELLEDEYPEERLEGLRGQLVDLFRSLCERWGRVEPEIARLLDAPIPVGVLTDLLGHYLGLSTPIKRSFLGEVRVDERARALVRILRCQLDLTGPPVNRDGGFPPPFSLN